MANTVRNDREKVIQKIVKLFIKNVKGKKSNILGLSVRHDGREGHWLETQMGIVHNANNKPDLYGFEMKNNTLSKTTFGDWSADYYIYNDEKYYLDRDKFLRIFGGPNINKDNRYSWSGRSCPKIGQSNIFGQVLKIDDKCNVFAMYSYDRDKRVGKSIIVPNNLRKNNLVLAKWGSESLRKRVENKFNNQGWFKCLKDNEGYYSEVVFGDPITFEKWIEGVKKGLIFFDSGMYQGNDRPYSQWRAVNKYWDSLVVERF